ncbi:MAG: chorismate mutase [Oligoflexales bacterium]
MKNPELTELRKKLEAIDSEIAALLAQRFDLCKDVAKVKKRIGIDVEDPNWEQEIFNRISQWEGRYSLNDQELTGIFRIILEFSRKTQHRLIDRNEV